MAARKRPTSKRRRAAFGHPRMKPVGRSETAAVARLRAICLSLPGVTEKIAWGEPTWRAGKIFAQMDTHHHGADHLAVWLPARPGIQEALVEENPEQFFRPPYLIAQLTAVPSKARRGWRAAWLDSAKDLEP